MSIRFTLSLAVLLLTAVVWSQQQSPAARKQEPAANDLRLLIRAEVRQQMEQDLLNTRAETDRRVQEVRQELRMEINSLRSEIQRLQQSLAMMQSQVRH